eukprot:TRINITY_DN13971_c0_g1_i1.p1 TRINITY_DN13971_c0_g1~~TRINITY_DN13971_c0_g1_i1.p1  ORF type:complete len:151 (+),score=4.01 TRINITY_DN13971_c0_g1_i1:211-663(+)
MHKNKQQSAGRTMIIIRWKLIPRVIDGAITDFCCLDENSRSITKGRSVVSFFFHLYLLCSIRRDGGILTSTDENNKKKGGRGQQFPGRAPCPSTQGFHASKETYTGGVRETSYRKQWWVGAAYFLLLLLLRIWSQSYSYVVQLVPFTPFP